MASSSAALEQTPKRVCDLAGRVAALAREILGEPVEVYWFGSWPRGEARQSSDLDIAVRVPTGTNPQRFAALCDAVEDLPTLYSFDIVNLDEVEQRFRDKILNEGVRL